MGYERISSEAGTNELKDKYIAKQPDNKENVSDRGGNIEYKEQTGWFNSYKWTDSTKI